MRTAQFDSTGSKVNIVFDQEVQVHDSKGIPLIAVDCSYLFADSVRLLGADAVCKLRSSTTLQIVLSSGATLLPSVKAQTDVVSAAAAQRNYTSKRALSLRDDRVKSVRDQSVSGLGCARVAAPSNPQPPVAVTLYRRRIGMCSTVRTYSIVRDHLVTRLGSAGWVVAFSNGRHQGALPATRRSFSMCAAASATIVNWRC